ncbi:MAG: indole-3-glycerol phosphate synthase TrpC [Thermodesulfovibrionales bacterium]|nr:indole-3-glycerol phosphate synthase TrpC [Thermodesulfovibrionales bacterium]
MSLFNKIVEKKKERLDFLKTKVPLKEIKSRASDIERPGDFKAALKRDSGPIKLIAEIKKASPLKGVIRQDFDPVTIASIYENKAVDAISVLTEEDYFQGKLEYLLEVKRVTNRALLRKDFIFDEYQIYESKANEVDAILLIASILDKNQAAEYLHLVKELELSALFEVHDFKELEMALLIDTDIIGINNRDLKTLSLDINTTFELKKEIPLNKIVVSESGITTREDVKGLEDAGIDSMLVGTAFLEAEDIGKKIDELMGKG